VAGNSAPASGSEHLISHAMDKLVPGKYLHGVQVGIATYIMALAQDYRVNRVRTFLTDTGFFDHVKKLEIQKSVIEEAVKLAPSIKPHRKTTIHDKGYMDKALEVISGDEVLKRILI